MENKVLNAVDTTKSTKRKGVEGIGTLMIFVVTILLALSVVAVMYTSGKSATNKAVMQSLLFSTPSASELIDAEMITLSGSATVADVKVKLINNGASNTVTLVMEADPTKATFEGYTVTADDVDFNGDKVKDLLADSETLYVNGVSTKTNSIAVSGNTQSVTYKLR
jgi:hypothetical protein